MQLHFCYPVSIKFPFITIKWDVKPFWMTQAETNNKFICDCVSISLSTSKCIETSIHSPSNERCHIVFRVKTTEIYCLNRIFFHWIVDDSMGIFSDLFIFHRLSPLSLKIAYKQHKIWSNSAIWHHSNQFWSREHECEQFGRFEIQALNIFARDNSCIRRKTQLRLTTEQTAAN